MKKKPASLAACGLKSNSKRVGGDGFTITRWNTAVRFTLVIADILGAHMMNNKARRRGLRALGSPSLSVFEQDFCNTDVTYVRQKCSDEKIDQRSRLDNQHLLVLGDFALIM
jgi:hypothetical protein